MKVSDWEFVGLLLGGLVCLTLIVGVSVAFVLIVLMGLADPSSLLGKIEWVVIGWGPFVVSAFVGYVLLSRRFTDPAQREIWTRLSYIGIGILTILLGAVFWTSFDSNYVLLPLVAAPNTSCCSGQPMLPREVALVPWLMILLGNLTVLHSTLRRREAGLTAILSFSLILTLMLPGVFGFFGSLDGWPLAWFGHTFGSCAFCTGPPIGWVIVLPFFLDWSFWGILTGGTVHAIQLRRKELLIRQSASQLRPLPQGGIT